MPTNDGRTAEERQVLINKADSAAYRALRQAHPQEFREAKVKAAADLGLDWKPRPSKDERERAQVKRILSDNEALREELKQELLSQMNTDSGFHDAP